MSRKLIAVGGGGAGVEDGISVTGAAIDGSGHLIITLSDSSTIDAGVAKGTNGTNGTPGTNGTNGVDGDDGDDGISITGVEIDGSNHLIVTLSDSSTIDAGSVGSGGGGGSSWTIVAHNTTATAAVNDFVWADMSGGPWQLTLPAPAANALVGVKIDVPGNVLTLVATGGALIEGQASITLEDDGASLTLGANGTKWGIL